MSTTNLNLILKKSKNSKSYITNQLLSRNLQRPNRRNFGYKYLLPKISSPSSSLQNIFLSQMHLGVYLFFFTIISICVILLPMVEDDTNFPIIVAMMLFILVLWLIATNMEG